MHLIDELNESFIRDCALEIDLCTVFNLFGNDTDLDLGFCDNQKLKIVVVCANSIERDKAYFKRNLTHKYREREAGFNMYFFIK